MEISKESPLPLYYQLREVLRQEIVQNNLMPGTLLPSESEMIERFNVSRPSVRRAISDLEAEGLIYREHGKGSFVRGQQIEQELTALTGFVEDMLELGYRPHARLIKTKQVPADQNVAKKLKLPLGTIVTYIERVRIANDIPLSFDTTWMPNDIGQKIIRDNLEVYPIYSLLEDKHGFTLEEADYVIGATVAMGRITSVLEVEQGAPIFTIERTANAKGGIPIDYELLYYRADRIRFAMRLKRKRPPWGLDVLDDLTGQIEKDSE